MKSKADKLDIGKLETAPVNIIKLSDVKNDFVRITAYDELVERVSNIKTTGIGDLVQKSWLWHKNRWNWNENAWSWSW